MIFLNFKIYQETSGENTLKLCQLIKDKRVIPCLQAVDIYRISQALPELEVWAQHADAVEYGKFTGYQSPFTLKTAGARGVILNHAEHQLKLSLIIETVKVCRRAGLKIMLLAPDLKTIYKFNSLKPDFIGFEDPKLISGSVAMIDAHKDLIKKAVAISQIPLIIGGGIRSSNHVQKSLILGGKGVLVASELAKSSNPGATLKDLISGLRVDI